MAAESLDILGASASTAGDDFHELWALRQALTLLDPRTELKTLVMEGVPLDETHAQVGSKGQAADVTRTFMDGRLVYEQLKYSSASPRAPWSWSRLLSRRVPSRRDTSILGKFADLHGATTGDRRLRLVTNQPLADAVAADLVSLSDMLRGGGSVSHAPLKEIEHCTGLTGAALADFLDDLDLSGFGEASRLRLETEIIRTISKAIDADARDDLRILHERISSLVLPENRGRHVVDRQTVTTWLGAGDHRLLFPASSAITPAEPYLVRDRDAELVAAIRLADPRLIRLHAGGGCGKTSFVARLDQVLGETSEVLVYDCYGDGLFLTSEGRRHLPDRSFIQVANELASRLGSPFALRPTATADLTVAFRNRVDAAARLVAERGDDALLVLVFDAADNARTAAEHWCEPCFLDELTAIGTWPANVRVVITCRTGRRASVGPDRRFRDLELGPFSEAETARYVARRQPTWSTRTITHLHDLSGGVPRRLAYALSGVDAARPKDAIARLMPRAPGMDPLFEHRVREAALRTGDEDAVWRLLCALARMPRPTPAWALAGAARIYESDIGDIANDLGGLRLTDRGWSFHDEDFEAFAGERTKALAEDILTRACDLLLERRGTDAYAAKSVGEALLAAGRAEALYDLAEEDQAIAALDDAAERIVVRRRRIVLGLRAARHAGDLFKARSLLLKAGHALRSHRLQRDVLTGNLEFAARFSPETVSGPVLRERRYQDRRGRLRLLLACATAATRPALARDHMRWWNAWLEDRGLRTDRRMAVTADDLAAEFEAHRQLSGLDYAVQALLRWRPRRLLFEVADRLARKALVEGRETDIDEALALGAWPRALHLRVAAIRLEHGLDLSPESLREAIRGAMAQSPPKHGGRGRVRAAGRAQQERVLRVLEAAAGVQGCEDDARRALARGWGIGAVPDRETGRWVETEGDLTARALALFADLGGEVPPLADFLPEPRPAPASPPPSRSRRTSRWSQAETSGAERAWRTFMAERKGDLETFESLFEVARLRRRSPGDAAVARAIADHAAKRARTDRWRRDASANALEALHAADVLLLDRPLTNLSAWIHPGLDPATGLSRLEALLRCTGRIAPLAECLIAYADAVVPLAAPASAKADLLVRCASVAIAFDDVLAGHYFGQALTVTADVDLEALEYLTAAAHAASDPVDASPDDRRTLAEYLADTASAVQASLGDDVDDHMPWENVITACAVQHAPTALAATGRWRDDGHVLLKTTLKGLADPRVTRRLSPLVRAGIFELSDALTPPADPTPLELEGAARRILQDGDLRRLDDAEAFGTLPPGLSTGPWVARLLSAAERLRRKAGAPDDEERDQGDDQEEDAVGEDDGVWTMPLQTSAQLQAALKVFAESFERPYQEHFRRFSGRITSKQLRCETLDAFTALYGDRGAWAETLVDLLPLWSDYPTVADWAARHLPGVIERTLPHLFGMNYRDPEALEDLLGLLAVTTERKIDLLLRAVERHGDSLSGSILITLTGVMGRLAEPGARAAYVTGLLDHTRGALSQPAANGVMGAMALHDEDEAFARFLFGVMGDVDRRVRWKASHAARGLLLEGHTGFAGAFIALLERCDEPVFARPDAVFYLHAARLQVAVVLHRVALERPAVLAAYALRIASLALAEPAHVLIREFLVEAAKAIDTAAPALSRATLSRLAKVNRPGRRAPLPAPIRRGLAPADTTRFRFDSMDTVPYWYSPAAAVFGIDRNLFCEMSERWILDEWRTPLDEWGGADEQRRTRWSHEEPRMSSHRHGGQPQIESLARHVEWHAMFCVMGELLRFRPSRPAGQDRSFEEWLGRYLLTERRFWLSELMGPPPLDSRFWKGGLSVAVSLDDWTPPSGVERFQSELFAPDGALVVEASFSRIVKDVTEMVSISSALVSSDTAQALASALETTRDSFDFCLPDGDGDHEIAERGFELRGWLAEGYRDPQLDKGDMARRSVQRLPIRPLASRFAPTGLRFDVDARAWVDETTDAPILHLDQWDWEGWDQGSSGRRATLDPVLLQDLLARRGCSLIVEVKINHVRTEDDDGADSRLRSWRLLVIDRDLAISHRDRDHPASRAGRYWVRRLGLEPGVNTLARWLVHHITDLDHRRCGADDAARATLEAKIVKAVRKLSSVRWR
jgi:hypothetical protein